MIWSPAFSLTCGHFQDSERAPAFLIPMALLATHMVMELRMKMMVMFNLIQGSGRGRDLDCPLIVSRSLLRATATVPQLQLQLQWDSLLRDPTVDFAPLWLYWQVLSEQVETQIQIQIQIQKQMQLQMSATNAFTNSAVRHWEVLSGQSVDRLSNCLRRALTSRL